MSGFNFEARTRQYSKKNARWLGRASQLAYDDEALIRSEVTRSWGFKTFEFWSGGNNLIDTQCFIAGNDEMLLLAFRGTHELKDWMTDINITLVGGPGGRVHEGFLMGLSLVWSQIITFICNERKGRALWVTGHSLGASLATLAVAKLRLERDEPVNGLYTFGQPRTGDRDFAKNFNADFCAQTFRYVNNNDIVARVPFRAMNYSHVGSFRYFDVNGNQRDDISWWDKLADHLKGSINDLLKPGTDGMKDHSMSRYMACLEKALD